MCKGVLMQPLTVSEIREFLTTLTPSELEQMVKEPVAKELDVEIIHKYAFRLCGDNDTAWEAVSKAWLCIDQTRSVGEQVNFMRKRVWRELHDQWRKDRRYISESALEKNRSKMSDEKNYNGVMEELTAVENDTNNTSLYLINQVLRDSPENIAHVIIFVMTHIFDGYFRTTIEPESIRNLLKNAKHLNIKNVRRTSQEVYEQIMWAFG